MIDDILSVLAGAESHPAIFTSDECRFIASKPRLLIMASTHSFPCRHLLKTAQLFRIPDKILKILYGIDVEIDDPIKGLNFLQAIDYYMVNGLSPVDYADHIGAMEMPRTPDLVKFITELREVYPSDKFPKKITRYLDSVLGHVEETEENRIAVFKSFWHLLPKSFTKYREHYLIVYEGDEGED